MSSIAVCVSVDWEGRSLLAENLRTIADFRSKHADVPMQHFLNAAYYTREGSNAARTTEAIQQAVLPGDEHGLHVHAWGSLLSAASVGIRSSPTFFDADTQVPRAADDWGFYPAEVGYEVPLEHFAVSELQSIVRTSLDILTSQGFRRPVSFRAGGWISGLKVQEAIVRSGLLYDCSAVDPQLTVRRFGDCPLGRLLRGLWHDIGDTSQPYRMRTSQGPLWQIPNNAGLVDYTTVDELLEVFRRNVVYSQNSRRPVQILSTGFHQETARRFLSRLDEAIDLMRRLAAENGLSLIFTARPWEWLDALGV